MIATTAPSAAKDTDSRTSLNSTEKKRTKRVGAKRLQGELDPSMVTITLPTAKEVLFVADVMLRLL